MDTLAGMRLFVRVVERASFTAAASDLGIPRSTATSIIQQLEARLGGRLLTRTSRHVALTREGDGYYRRCLAILAAVEEAEGGMADDRVRGMLRIDVNGHVARSILLPALPAFLGEHPELQLHVGDGDRLVDLAREDVDCVIRSGQPVEGDLIQRRITLMPEVTVASPAYLAVHGHPQASDGLRGHRMVGYLSPRSGRLLPLEFVVGSEVVEVTLPWRVSASNAETSAELCRQGHGLLQAPLFRFREDLRSGRLVGVMEGCRPTPTPLSLLYPSDRQRSPRVRVFAEWAIKTMLSAFAV